MSAIRTSAAVLDRPGGELSVVEVELEAPRSGEVLVRLASSGVCHTDLNVVDGRNSAKTPVVLGHEGAGVIEAAGPGTRLTPGTRVVLSWLTPCGRCDDCDRGLIHLCSTAWELADEGGLLDRTSRIRLDGETIHHYSLLSTFAGHTVVPEACCLPLPDSVPTEVGALIGCAATTGIGAVWNTAGVRPGERVAVFGCGGVGLSAIMGAAAAGASEVIAVDVSDRKLEDARSVGATTGLLWSDGEATAAEIRDLTRGGVDYAFEATGRPEAARAALMSTRTRGTAVIIGIPKPGDEVTVPAMEFRRERRIVGSVYGSSRPAIDFPRIMAGYAAGSLPLDRLVSHRVPLEELPQALDLVRAGDARRVILSFDR